ncbi:MAG: PilZ domain-containing protein [Myxococcota bacterium]|nr:PilZ domain-containing protein [Myxococcota bacterium]
MAHDVSNRKVLILHDGELADLRALVESLGAQVIEVGGSGEAETDFDVVLATPRRLREISRSSARPEAVRIAVLERDARTLRALCRRTGVDLVVLRPVHPTAVRLLLLHALYRGPDRRVRRVAVGVPVRFRSGFRSHGALLADLSTRGCQLVGCRPRMPGKHLKVSIPDPAVPGRSFVVAGQVVRLVRGLDPGFAVEFLDVGARTREQLQAAIASYAEGPAPCHSRDVATAWRRFAPPPTPAGPPDEQPSTPEASAWEASSEADFAAAQEPHAERASPSDSVAHEGPAPDAERTAAEILADDRRRHPRHRYDGRRIVALDEEAARVLVGHDLSLDGMRVVPNPALRVGQQLRVALYGSPGETPLVIETEVMRDDGERGLVLRFESGDEGARRYLAKMLDSLPVLDGGRESAPGLVVSEILDGPEG